MLICEKNMDCLDCPITDPNEQCPHCIEVEPVKHGHWIEEGLVDGNGNRYCRCSNCEKGDTQAISQIVPYCWWCGAKMDEVGNG